MSRLLLVSSVAALMCMLPAAAAASTLRDLTKPGDSGATLQYRAAAGETNDLTIDFAAGTVFEDGGAWITPGPGCSATATGAACPVSSFIKLMDVDLRDGDDHAHINGYGHVIDLDVAGGSGADTVWAVAGGDARVRGDSGNDVLFAEGDVTATADGGGGDDEVTVQPYIAHGVATGGSGSDQLYFRPAGEVGSAADMDGGSGADIIVAETQPRSGSAAANTFTGGAGNDVIAVQNTTLPWTMVGATMIGGDGDDSILGGPGADIVDSGPGRDVIDIAGGAADTVTCGEGIDVVRYDDQDTVDIDCEIKLAPTS